MRRAFLTLTVVVLSTGALASFGFAQQAQQEESSVERGVQKIGNQPAEDDTELRYRKQWAIVIGINYDYGEGTLASDRRAAGASTLKNAENDARAFAELLKTHYGYTDDTVKLLLGKEATFINIRTLLSEAYLLDSSQIAENDSVLIYFAGHGDSRANAVTDDTKALLFPYDVNVLKDGKGGIKGVNSTWCTNVGFIRSQLEACPARHKLIILDSCYSGEMFNIEGQRSTARFQLNPRIFREKTIRGIAATRSFQTAADAGRISSEHSPFTSALLAALNGGIRSKVFGSSALESVVRETFRKSGSEQIPIGGSLSGNGDFFFFRQTEFPKLPDVPASLAVYTMPGLHGEWWFDECPWLIPGLRVEEEFRNALPLDRGASRLNREKLASVSRGPVTDFLHDPDVTEVYMRLRNAITICEATLSGEKRRTLRLLQNVNWSDVSQQTAEDLIGGAEKFGDPHLLAAVHHRLGRNADALYEAAIKAYEDRITQTEGDEQTRYTALKSLCHSDYGQWLFVAGKYSQAVGQYQIARSRSTDAPPRPMFDLVALCDEADAHRRLSQWSQAERCLEQALGIAQDSLSVKHPLRAYVHERFAWMDMDQWQLQSAVHHFNEAIRLRTEAGSSDLATRISIFHDRHGLAMAHRFSGQVEQARDGYERLWEELKEISASDLNGRDRQIVALRLVNTLERLADCCLYSPEPRPQLAYEATDEAIEHCRFLAPAIGRPKMIGLFCRQAVALALAGYPEPAMAQLQRIQEGEYYQSLIAEQHQEVDFYLDVAEAIIGLKGYGDQAESVKKFREVMRRYASGDARETLNRDELEPLLFGMWLLVRSQLEALEPGASGDRTLQRDAERLLRLVPEEFVNTADLPYLRPYYEAALRARLTSDNPFEIRGIIEQLVLVKTGDHGYSLDRDASTLAIFLAEKDGHAVLYPRGSGMLSARIYRLPFGRSNLEEAQWPEELLTAMTPLQGRVEWRDTTAIPAVTNEQFPLTLPPGWSLVEREAATGSKPP